MEQIILKRAGGFSTISVPKQVYRKDSENPSIDIKMETSDFYTTVTGVYETKDVTEFIQQLSELLGLTITKDMSKEEPYILPDELVEKLKYELSKNQPDSDQFIWEACTEDSDTVIGNWVQETDNAIEQLWNIFQGHPFEAEKFYVLRDSDDDYLSSYTIASDGTAEGDLTMYPSNAVKFYAKEDAEAVQRLLKDYHLNIEKY